MHCVRKASSASLRLQSLQQQKLQQPVLRLNYYSRTHVTDPSIYILRVPPFSFSFYSYYRQQQQRRTSSTHRAYQYHHRLFNHQNASVTCHLRDTSRQRRARTEHHISMEAAKPHASSGGGSGATFDPIVQYIVIRRDLRSDINSGGNDGKAATSPLAWPFGSVVAQACHASVAAIASALGGGISGDADAITLQYIHSDNVDRMHKVVLEVKNEEELIKLGKKLEENGIIHKMWIEQPENFATCLALKPYIKSEVAQHLKKLKLAK